MMKFLVLILSMLSLIGCGSGEKDFKPKFAPSPLKRVQTIKLSHLEEFDCTDFAVDEKSNLFLLDGAQVKIVKLSPSGNKEAELVKKGEGPGEIKDYPSINFSSYIWLSSYRKVCQYSSSNLKLIKDLKLKKGGHKLTPLNSNTWLFTKQNNDSKDWKTELWKQSFNGKELKLFSMAEGDMLIVPYNRGTVAFFPGTPLCQSLIFCKTGNNILSANSLNYKLYLKTPEGKLLKELEIPHKNPIFTDKDKRDTVENFITQFNNGLPEGLKKGCKKALPDELSALVSIRALPHNRIFVKVTTGYEKYREDIFDQKLNYLYSLKEPIIKGADTIKTFNNRIYGLIKEDEEDRIEIYTMN